MTYNHKLKHMIKEKGFTQFQFAEKTSITNSVLSGIITGRINANPKEQNTISKHLCVKMRDLFNANGTPNTVGDPYVSKKARPLSKVL